VPVTILHTNDFHGTLSPQKAARIRALKEEAPEPAYYFDSGDCIKAGNLGFSLKPEEAWPLLVEAGCDASVLGNRESHVVESAFRGKLVGAAHPILVANLRFKLRDTRPFPGHMIFDRGGVKVGVVGVMVPMVTEGMASAMASAYLWDLPIPTALNLGHELREQVDLLIALTHIGLGEDEKLASHGIYDIILGGHTHAVIEQPRQIGSTWICQGGSHGRYVGRYTWSDGELTGGLLDLV
jgi:5'-nucleotidase